ncbi:MAG TPA: hypothetical protein VLA46_03590 [Saprospiraceae bacterium]|nr:hypothetical protein [Saprospiraceae bacterium]
MEYSNEIIEHILQTHRQDIGIDFAKYRNHVYRVFHNCLLIDNDKGSLEKYAIASAFHDIGIWTNHTIDYLDPSIKEAELYLIQSGKQSMAEEIQLMIYWHHKVTRYEGPYKTVAHFRKADWIDVSLGWLTFGHDRRKIETLRNAFPNKGFHLYLLKQIAYNFFRHPFNPLPMFKQ